MDPRRPPRTVIDPKIRQVGFLPNHPPDPTAASTSAAGAGPSFPSSPPINPLSPVMIPLPVHDTSLPRPVPAPRRSDTADSIPVGSYDPSDSLLARSPVTPAHIREAEDSEGENMSCWMRSESGKLDGMSPGPSLGFNMSGVNSMEGDSAGENKADAKTSETANTKLLTGGRSVNKVTEKRKDNQPNLKPLKEKLTKAERRALQESQRAAKAEAKVSGNRQIAGTDDKAGKALKQPLQKKAAFLVASFPSASDKKGVDRPVDKDKKRDLPAPRMQYDDKKRVDRAKKRSIVKQTESRNSVELFQHLRQYEHGDQLQDLEAKFFSVGMMHPAVYKVGLQLLASGISGANSRCIAMLLSFKEAIKDYHVPAEKVLFRDLTARISSYVSFLSECRPLSISMGNAIRLLKTSIAKLPSHVSESEAKATLCSDIDRLINDKIILAEKLIVRHAATKISDGDVLLTYGSSTAVELILSHAREQGKQFRVVIIDSRPKLEGQSLLRRLVSKGLNCTYTHINAVSYIMHEVTTVLLGAASVLSNGTVYSRIGTACVAMVAHAFRVPVLVCCEAYKFHERVQLDSICSNELGDPDAISKVPGRSNVNFLNNWSDTKNLQLLNLLYDITPSEYVSMIVTDYGMIPPTSVPVIVHEYRKIHLFV
ncbi:hypothetical protein V2J09_019427 [Rumex salicifolius]